MPSPNTKVGYKYIEINKKSYRIPQKELDNLMDKLDLSEKEAIDLWLFDHNAEDNEQVKELTKKAKENKTDKIVVQSSVEKKKTERKPKQNPLKQQIIEYLYQYLIKNSSLQGIKVENPTKTIDFYAEGKHFSLNLVEHRQKTK